MKGWRGKAREGKEATEERENWRRKKGWREGESLVHNTKYNYSSVFSNSSFLNSCYKHRFENDSHNAGRQPLTREASVSRAGSRPAADCPSAIACAMAEGQKPLRQRQIPSAFPLVWFPLDIWILDMGVQVALWVVSAALPVRVGCFLTVA